MEFMCATARYPVCHCACGGKHHGKHRHLKERRDAEGPWSSAEARAMLANEREWERARQARLRGAHI